MQPLLKFVFADGPFLLHSKTSMLPEHDRCPNVCIVYFAPPEAFRLALAAMCQAELPLGGEAAPLGRLGRVVNGKLYCCLAVVKIRMVEGCQGGPNLTLCHY